MNFIYNKEKSLEFAMNEECIKFHKRLLDLQKLHVRYTNLYNEALTSAEENSENRDESFQNLKKTKDGIKKLIKLLQLDFPKVEKKYKKELRLQRKRYLKAVEAGRYKEMLKSVQDENEIEEIWFEILQRLKNNPELIESLMKMEETGGEPELVWYDKKQDQYIFIDCSEDSPPGRGNIYYDKSCELANSKFAEKCNGNAEDMAKDMGIEILTEEDYLRLIQVVRIDPHTVSFIYRHPDTNFVSSRYPVMGRVEYDPEPKPEKYELSDHFIRDSLSFRGLLRV